MHFFQRNKRFFISVIEMDEYLKILLLSVWGLFNSPFVLIYIIFKFLLSLSLLVSILVNMQSFIST